MNQLTLIISLAIEAKQLGLCVAGDKLSHAAMRQMMCCTVTGQGAGVAAAVSVKDHVTCRQVNISKVQKALEKQGVRIK
jgi:hypothetical protein